MADFDFDNPAFEPNEEYIGDDDFLSNQVVATQGPQTLQLELLQTAVDDYYNQLDQWGLTPAFGRDPSKFELVDGCLRLKAYPHLDLTNKRTGNPLAFSTIAGRPSGSAVIREELGFADWTRKRSDLPAQAVESLQTANQQLGVAATAVDTIELQDLGQTAT